MARARCARLIHARHDCMTAAASSTAVVAWWTPMLSRLAISNYRSLRDFVTALERLNLVTGPNGSGKLSGENRTEGSLMRPVVRGEGQARSVR
jgi:hypothetical protein